MPNPTQKNEIETLSDQLWMIREKEKLNKTCNGVSEVIRMPLPEKREDLVAMGYVFDNEAHCRGCGEAIEWWITPKGKKMPMSVKEVKKEENGFFAPVEKLILIPHWTTCPNADDFKGKRK
jgi:hypothetical protein